MAIKHFPTLEGVLKSYYPFLDTDGWIEDEFPETGDTSFETECDNFPVAVETQTLYLEAVFYVFPLLTRIIPSSKSYSTSLLPFSIIFDKFLTSFNIFS